MICNIQDPITQQDYTRDPRNIARKAVSYMKSTGLADTCRLAPELEFFVFDDVRFDQNGHEAYYHVDSAEGAWNRGRAEGPNLGYKAGSGLGYFPCPPTDSLADLRTEMSQRMAECGISTAAHYHEAATGGQSEIDLAPQPLIESADQVMLARYIIRTWPAATARRRPSCPSRSTATTARACTPTSRSGRTTSPPCRQRLRRLQRPRDAGHRRLLRHAPALCAFANPTTNSYKRLVPGFEAPTKLSYSRRNRAAVIRIPVHSPNPKSRRIEFRVPTVPRTRISSTRPCSWPPRRDPDQGPTRRSPRQGCLRPPARGARRRPQHPPLPRRLARSPPGRPRIPPPRRRLHPDIIDTWIWYKRTHEIETLRARPHPFEFTLYYDI